MENFSPAVGRKRARTPDEGLVAGMQHSPLDGLAQPGPDTEPADVLAFFAARGSRATMLLAEIDRLRANSQQQAAAVETAEHQSVTLKAENLRLAALSEAQANQADQERHKLRAALQSEFKRVADLSKQLEKQNTEQSQAAPRPAPEAVQHSRQPADDAAVQRLQEEVEQLGQQLRHAAAQAEDDRRRHVQQQQQALRQADADSQHIHQLQQQLDQALEMVSSANITKSDVTRRALAAEQQIAAAEANVAASSVDTSAELRNLRQELAASEHEVAQSRKLKEYVSNVEILKEKLHAASQRAQRAEDLLAAGRNTDAEIASLKAELAKWTEFYKGVADVQNPEQVLHMLQQLQRDRLSQVNRLTQASAESNSLRGQLEQARQQQEEHEAAIAAACDTQNEADSRAARLERQLAVLGKERDSLKRILASYQLDDARSGIAERDSLSQARTGALEAALETLQGQLQGVEAALSRKTEEAVTRKVAVAEARAQAVTAEARMADLETEAEQLSSQVATMQERLGRGEFNPEITRVLHLVQNPEAEEQRQAAEARIAQLSDENSALRSQLERLEAQGGSAQSAADAPGGVEPGVAAALTEAELAIARRKVVDAEKQTKRLKQVFNQQIVSFREACYFLFGYKVDAAAKATAAGAGAAPTTFVLTPQNGEQGAQLMFSLKSKGGGMELLPNEYVTKRLKRDVETFIGRFKSIPAFTANLTMETFQKSCQ